VRTRLRRGKRLLEEEIERIRGGKEVLQSTITNFDLWARKLRDMLRLRPKK
jgi:hypothetical protein